MAVLNHTLNNIVMRKFVFIILLLVMLTCCRSYSIAVAGIRQIMVLPTKRLAKNVEKGKIFISFDTL